MMKVRAVTLGAGRQRLVLMVFMEEKGYETVQDSGEGEIALMAKIKLHQRVLI